MSSVLFWAVIGFGPLYPTFVEWVLHLKFMHNANIPLASAAHEEHHKKNVTLLWFYRDTKYLSRIPFVIIPNMLVFEAVYHFLSPLLGIYLFSVSVLHIVIYEFTHWLMHLKTLRWAWQRWIRNTCLFRFLTELHRVHHLHHDRNENVLLPLADAILGTLDLEELLPEPDGPQDMRGPLSVLPSWIRVILTPKVRRWMSRNIPPRRQPA